MKLVESVPSLSTWTYPVRSPGGRGFLFGESFPAQGAQDVLEQWQMDQPDQHSNSLCNSCSHVREVVSGTGSRFLLCQLSKEDRSYPKYPPQPVLRCDGFKEADNA